MNQILKRLAYCAATSAFLFIPATSSWAVPLQGTAHLFAQDRTNAQVRGRSRTATEYPRAAVRNRLPYPIHFQEVSGRGLLVSGWINGAGPFTFAVDTGAGATILSRRVATEAGVVVGSRRPVIVGGLSDRASVTGQEVSIGRLALGDEQNILPSTGPAVVLETLAPGIDGVLDPVDAFWPLGFEIDFRRSSITIFDPRLTPLRRGTDLSYDSAVVPWLQDGVTRRPFVSLESGHRALIDTGSGLGLALTSKSANSLGVAPGGRRAQPAEIRDLAGGTIDAHRIAPTNIRIGSLVLNGIPTDLIPNANAKSPILLGRDALRPFRLAFDPISRLIRFIAS